jgi:hypothetical protein
LETEFFNNPLGKGEAICLVKPCTVATGTMWFLMEGRGSTRVREWVTPSVSLALDWEVTVGDSHLNICQDENVCLIFFCV